MSPDSEPQAVELEAEQEVDFGRYARTIAARCIRSAETDRIVT